MPVLIALVTIISMVGAYLYYMRTAADTANDLADVASGVMSAARRFGFRRHYNTHPIDSVDDPILAAGALTVAFIEQGPPPTQDQRDRHVRALQSHLNVSKKDAEELLIMGHWFVNESNGAATATARLGRRLMRLAGAEALDAPLLVINDVAAANNGLNDTQRDSLDDLRRIFRR